MSDNLLQIGVVCRAHGLHGELRVKLHDPNSSALQTAHQLWTGPAGPGAKRAWTLEQARPQTDGYYLITLAGIADRNTAEALHLCPIYVNRSELEPLADDEFYVNDLVGCTVLLPTRETVGVVSAVQKNPGNDLMVVRRPGRADALVPIVPQIVTAITLSDRQVTIDPPEGLLDLDLGPELGPQSGDGD